MSGGRDVIAAGIGVLFHAALLQQHLHLSLSPAQQPEVSGAVANALPMGGLPVNDGTGGDPVLIYNIQKFHKFLPLSATQNVKINEKR